jgi:hypothetical protein
VNARTLKVGETFLITDASHRLWGITLTVVSIGRVIMARTESGRRYPVGRDVTVAPE